MNIPMQHAATDDMAEWHEAQAAGREALRELHTPPASTAAGLIASTYRTLQEQGMRLYIWFDREDGPKSDWLHPSDAPKAGIDATEMDDDSLITAVEMLDTVKQLCEISVALAAALEGMLNRPTFDGTNETSAQRLEAKRQAMLALRRLKEFLA